MAPADPLKRAIKLERTALVCPAAGCPDYRHSADCASGVVGLILLVLLPAAREILLHARHSGTADQFRGVVAYIGSWVQKVQLRAIRLTHHPVGGFSQV